MRHRDIWPHLLKIKASRKKGILSQDLMLFGDIQFASGYDSMMSVRGSKYLLVYFCSYIFIAFLCIYTKRAEMLRICVCLTETSSVQRLLIQLEPPERLTAK